MYIEQQGLKHACRRLSYKPHLITWAEVSEEAATGKLFRMHALDRDGRPVLVMRPRYAAD